MRNEPCPNGVLVGVGSANQDCPAGEGFDAVELMIEAARAAGRDTGAPQVLQRVERVLVTQGTWKARDAGATIAGAIGAADASSVFVQLGIPQQALIDQALHGISSGEVGVVMVVGGEAKARDDRARRAGTTLAATVDSDRDPDEVQTPQSEIVARAEAKVGFVVPVQQYAAIDNALRRAEHATVEDHLAQIDSLWARFDRAAGANPSAAFAGGRAAHQLRSNADGNRMLAFPYNKWHATQWSVDQAAAIILCAESVADELGIERERRIHPLVSLESSHSLTLTRRALLHRWPAMHVLGAAAESHLGQRLRDLDLVELYSCFPAAVRVQQRELGLPLDATPTLTGGMPFAGGPFNNFVFQATARMVDELRNRPGTRGLITTVSGLLTKPGLAVWSSDAGDRTPLLADLAVDAAEATPQRPIADDYSGPATVATYTVRPTIDGGVEIVAIADTPANERVAVTISDPDLAEQACTHEFIGTTIDVAGTTARA